MFNRFEI